MVMTLTQQETPYAHWEFVHPDSADRLRVVPERGGLVTEWISAGRELLYFDRERFKDPAKSVRGGIPVLFPICGDLPGDLLPLPGGEFKLKQHGFARDLPWQLKLLADQTGILLSLVDNDLTRAVYPFSFLIEMEVRLLSQTLAITIRVQNRGTESMPFSLGLHPYFKVIDLARVRLEGLPATCLNHLQMIETDTASQLGSLMKGVDFLTRPASDVVTLVDEAAGRRLQLQHQPPMDLTVVWTDPPRSMLCLEPWTGPRQALISGDRKLELQPGASQELSCRYSIR